MRRFFYLLLTVCVLAVSGCGSAPAPRSTGKSKPITNELSEKGIELIRKVDQLAECEEYISLCTASKEITDLLHDIGEKDYAVPQGIFVIEDLDAVVRQSMLPDKKLPEDVAVLLNGRFATALPSQITARNGTMHLAAMSILHYAESFRYEGLDKTVTYLYPYGNGYSFLINYSANSENIVSAEVAMVTNSALSNCASPEDVRAFFADTFDFKDVSVTAATAEK